MREKEEGVEQKMQKGPRKHKINHGREIDSQNHFNYQLESKITGLSEHLTLKTMIERGTFHD